MFGEMFELILQGASCQDWVAETNRQARLPVERRLCHLGDPSPSVFRFNEDRNTPRLEPIIDPPVDWVLVEGDNLNGGIKLDFLPTSVEMLAKSEFRSDLDTVAFD